MRCRHLLPGFRATCLGVGATYVVIGGAVLARGAEAMAEYAVPPDTIASPHYADAITWVYLHMVVLGLVTAVVGWHAQGEALRAWFSRLMFGVHVIYTALDARSSDVLVAGALYRGPASVIPAVVCVVVTVLFAHLALCRDARAEDG